LCTSVIITICNSCDIVFCEKCQTLKIKDTLSKPVSLKKSKN
jgi:hypothetical protein